MNEEVRSKHRISIGAQYNLDNGEYSTRKQKFLTSRKIGKRILLSVLFSLPIICISISLIVTPSPSVAQGSLVRLRLALINAIEWCFYGFAIYKILIPCLLWYHRVRVLGFPSWQRCAAAIRVRRIASISTKVAGPMFSIGFALGFMLGGAVIAGAGIAWDVGVLRGLGIYILSGGLVDLIIGPFPPGVLLLAPSSAELVTYQSMLDYALGGPCVVSLIDPEQTELPGEAQLPSEFVFRTARVSEWFELMRALSYLAEIIVLDTRYPIKAIVREAKWVLSDRYTARKLFLVVGNRDESPVIDEFIPGVRVLPGRRFTASGLLLAFEQASRSRSSLREFLASTGRFTGLPAFWKLR